ncbi:imidazoleglycerol-phosphate dehydratase HisB [Candidatus Bathyarchaeota archaeon]|nr:MAG: imidazoleglycerol-phosphate dehydratase HisB [Candidatus Bathyarchaeota archaeon]
MRLAKVKRSTKETVVEVNLNLDGEGKTKLQTGKPFFDHLLDSFAFHGMFDLEVYAESKMASGDHHLIEDVGLVLGQALEKALGEKEGIGRFGNVVIPMDDALILVSVDLSGRIYFESNLKFEYEKIEEVSSQMINHFLKSFAEGGKFNLHVVALRGINDHHKAEATFKALGKALNQAVKIKTERRGKIPSVKGVC